MKFLILGGGGFIGSHFVEYLVNNRGEDVTVLDDFSTGVKNNLHNVLDIDLIVNNTTRNLNYLISKTDYVYHFAGSVGVKYINDNPKESVLNNLNLILNVCELAEKYNKPVLFTSTSEVYGNSENLPFSEENELCIGPSHEKRWSYSCAKLMGEFLLKSHNFPSVVIRPFNIVGERQVSNYGMVLPTFIKKAMIDDDIIINGDGKQIRCFCYVKDILEPLYRLLTEPEFHNETYNIGNRENAYSIKDIAEIVIEQLDSNSKIVYTDKIENNTDVYVRVPNIDKIKNKLNWKPTTNIEDIIDVCASFTTHDM